MALFEFNQHNGAKTSIQKVANFIFIYVRSIAGYSQTTEDMIKEFLLNRQDTYSYIDDELANKLDSLRYGNRDQYHNFDLYRAIYKRFSLLPKNYTKQQFNAFLEDTTKYCQLLAITLSRETEDFLSYYANRTTIKLPDDIRLSHDPHFGDQLIQTSDFLGELADSIVYLGKGLKPKIEKSKYFTYDCNYMVLDTLRQLYNKSNRNKAKKLKMLTGDAKNPEVRAIYFVEWATPAFEIIVRNYDLATVDRKRIKVMLNAADKYGYESEEFRSLLDKANKRLSREKILERRTKYKYITKSILSDEKLMEFSLSQLADINYMLKNHESMEVIKGKVIKYNGDNTHTWC